MNLGTNNYNALKLTPSEEIVSRTIQTNYKSYTNVIWRTGKPALDSEWNLINDLSMEMFTNTIRSVLPSGWLNLGKNKHTTNSGISNTIEFYAQENQQDLVLPNAIVNGWPLLVGGTNYSSSILNRIVLEAPGSRRTDFVFLEVWRAQLRARDENNAPYNQNKPTSEYVYKFGNVQFAGTNLPDDSIDTVFNEETSERVQIQYRIRTVPNVIFTNTDSSGFENSSVQAQGAGSTPQLTGYGFTNMATELGDAGLWRAGNGNQASQTTLKTVDGYVYAIPMFKISRRGTNPYNDTAGDLASVPYNQAGNSTALSSLVSDRPDKKFNDGIDASDIVDLRNKIALSLNYQKIMEQNLDKLFRGTLKSNWQQTLAYDSISDTDVLGYNDFLSNAGASGKRIFWSDAITQQSDIFAKVTTTTFSTSLDVYRGAGTGNWAIGNTIVFKTTTRLPVGTIIKATPRLYLEDTAKTPITGGTWFGLNTDQATYALPPGIWVGTNYSIWVYYDLELPANQGLTYTPDELLRVQYFNSSLFGSSGTVVRGTNIKTETMRYQDLLQHPFENKTNTETFTETSLVKQRKQIKVSPLIQTTSEKNGATRTLQVETLNKTAKTVHVPYPLQHLRGVYTSATGGTEIAMQQVVTRLQVSDLIISENKILLEEDSFIGTLTSLQYIPSGVGSEIELLGYIYQGSALSFVLEHKVVTGSAIGSRIILCNQTGDIWPIPIGATESQFKWAGTRIKVRQSAGYGYDIGGYIIDCSQSYNNSYINSMADRQPVWLDCDYLGAPHDGADIRMIYSYTPYQGSSVGGQTLSLAYKREKGIFFNNGTGGGTISVTGSSGTSNQTYTPVSPRLPGSLDDHLRNGTAIEITSPGKKRYNTDFWSAATYDLYGYHGGGQLWSEDYTMPTLQAPRGFFGLPMLEVIFEEPLVDATYAEFVMPILVKDKITGQLYLMVQIGNKGIHTGEIGENILIDLFHLEERIITK